MVGQPALNFQYYCTNDLKLKLVTLAKLLNQPRKEHLATLKVSWDYG
jgi:hypothetical protein